jgi:hypothetical protein
LNGKLLFVYWNFVDEISTGFKINYVFRSAGRRKVTCTVVNGLNFNSSVTFNVDVYLPLKHVETRPKTVGVWFGEHCLDNKDFNLYDNRADYISNYNNLGNNAASDLTYHTFDEVTRPLTPLSCAGTRLFGGIRAEGVGASVNTATALKDWPKISYFRLSIVNGIKTQTFSAMYSATHFATLSF